MLVVFLDVEDYSASDLDLGQKVEVSQDEEDLALLLEILPHVLLIDEQVIVHVWVPILSVSVLVAV